MDSLSRDKIRDSEKRQTVNYYNPNSPTLSPNPQLVTWHSLYDKNQEKTPSPNYSVKTSPKPYYFPQKTSYNPLQNSKTYSDWEKNVLNKIKLNFKETNVINSTKEPEISHEKGENVIKDTEEPNYDFMDADHTGDDIKNPTADFIYNDYSVYEMQRPQYYDDYYGVEEMKQPDKNDIKWPTNLNGGDYIIDEMKRPAGDFIDGDYVIDEMKRPAGDFIEGDNIIEEMKQPDEDFIEGDYVIDEMKRPDENFIEGDDVIDEMKQPDEDFIEGDNIIDEMKRPDEDFIDGDNIIDEMKRPDEDFIDGDNIIDEMKRPDMVATLPTTSFPPQYKPTYRPDVGLTTSRPIQIPTGGSPIPKPPQYKPTFQPAILVSIKPTVNPEMLVRILVYNHKICLPFKPFFCRKQPQLLAFQSVCQNILFQFFPPSRQHLVQQQQQQQQQQQH